METNNEMVERHEKEQDELVSQQERELSQQERELNTCGRRLEKCSLGSVKIIMLGKDNATPVETKFSTPDGGYSINKLFASLEEGDEIIIYRN